MSILSAPTRSLILRAPYSRDPLWRRAQQVPAFDIDYTRQSIVDPIGGITPTFTRAGSVKLAWNGSQFVSYAADVPAFQLAADGGWEYLHEPAATNGIRNNSMVGAAAGTPGTLPTNWSVANLSGLSQQVVGTATEAGVQCIDLRFFGTANASAPLAVSFDTTTGIAATNATVYAISSFVCVVSGSPPSPQLTLSQRGAAGVFLADLSSTITLSSALTRYQASFTTSQASIQFYAPRVGFNLVNGQSYDFTVRIGWPQAELGPVTTSPIVTAGSAVLRAADSMVVSGASFSSWFAPGGVLYGEFTANRSLPGTIASIDDGTASHRMQLRFIQSSGLKVRSRWVSPSSNIDQISNNAILGVTSKAALSCGLDRRAASDGVLIDPGTTTTLPTVTQMTIGSAVASDSSPVGIRRLAYFSPGTAQANLLAMTA